jgi:hypothetical protein
MVLQRAQARLAEASVPRILYPIRAVGSPEGEFVPRYQRRTTAAYAIGGSIYGRAVLPGDGLVRIGVDGSAAAAERTHAGSGSDSHSGPRVRRPSGRQGFCEAGRPSRREEEEIPSRQEGGQEAGRKKARS